LNFSERLQSDSANNKTSPSGRYFIVTTPRTGFLEHCASIENVKFSQ